MAGKLTRAGRDELRMLVHTSRDVVVLAAVTGAFTGLAVAGFDRLVVNVLLDAVFRLSPWALAFIPLAGLAVVVPLLRFGARSDDPATTDAYLRDFHDPAHALRLREVPGRVAAAIATLGSGGAMGLEGPSLYIGAGIGSFVRDRLGRRRTTTRTSDDGHRRTLLVAGAAAGVAAIFKAPATGAVFALEVPYQDDIARGMLLPALVGSATSYLTFVAVNGTAPILPVRGSPPFSLTDLLGAVLLGVAAGLGARTFAWMLRVAKKLASIAPPAVRALGGGLAVAGVFAIAQAITDGRLTVGVGYHAIAWALDPGRAAWLVFVVLMLRCVATAATVSGGGVGGLFIPLVVAGALLGRVAAGVAGDVSTTLFIVIGVAAFLGAGYRVPLAAVMFVAETTGRPGFVVPGLLAAVAAELVMGRSSVTAYQRPRVPVPRE